MQNKIEVFDKVEKVVYLTPVSPVILVSTVNGDGTRNLAPFAMFMNCSSRPPMVALGISPKTDTFHNITETNQFVIGIPVPSILLQLCKAGLKYDSSVDEFQITGLTPYVGPNLKAPRVEQCCINLDCKLVWTKEAGNHQLVVAEVVGADIDTSLYNDNKVLLRSSISVISHITGNHFIVNGKPIEISL